MGVSWGDTDRELREDEISQLDPATRERIRREQRRRRDPLEGLFDGDEPDDRRDGGRRGWGW